MYPAEKQCLAYRHFPYCGNYVFFGNHSFATNIYLTPLIGRFNCNSMLGGKEPEQEAERPNADGRKIRGYFPRHQVIAILVVQTNYDLNINKKLEEEAKGIYLRPTVDVQDQLT